MLKKIFYGILFLLFVAVPAHAELKVDIIAGNVSPVSVAVQKVEAGAGVAKSDAEMVRGVVENDLKSTGLFRMINKDAFPQFVKFNDMPDFNLWYAIKAQVLVQSKMTKQENGLYKLEFYVWDLNGKEQIEAQSLAASKKSIRRMAHLMADAIYERLTGEVGYFDTQIVFIAETGDVSSRVKRMAIMDQDGYGMRYLSDKDTFVMSPRFSPDGEKVAMSLVQGGDTHLFEYNIETKELRQLTFGHSLNTSPSYSPDGTRLAFNSDKSGSQQIHIMDLATGEEERITFGAGRYATPAWSPDGQFIAFTKIADDTFYIGIMGTDGKHEKFLAGGWYMEAPSWAPGSRRLVYYETEKSEDGQDRMSHLRTVDITGQNLYDIELPDGINGVEPTWSPKLQ